MFSKSKGHWDRADDLQIPTVCNMQPSYVQPPYHAHFTWSTVMRIVWIRQRTCATHLLRVSGGREYSSSISFVRKEWNTHHYGPERGVLPDALLAALKRYLNLWYYSPIKACGYCSKGPKECVGGAVPSHWSLFCWVYWKLWAMSW